MKKILALGVAFIIGLTAASSVFAVASLPSNAVWYEPASVTAGTAITLHALVYNNQSSSATVTVDFTAPTGKVATVTAVIPPQNAKTLSANWNMPKASTVVTGAVTVATNTSKHSIPTLLGTLGTITIAPAAPTVTTTTSLPSFPGSVQLSAWFGPLFTKIEAFRIKEATYFTQLRDQSKKAAGLAVGSSIGAALSSSTPASDATNKIFSHSSDYFNYFYASALAPVFSNQIFFYIIVLLFVLLALRFIVNLIF